MSEARDPESNRIDAESAESVKSCPAKVTGQMAAHHGVPKGFQPLANRAIQAPKRIKFCHWIKCHEWFMPDGGTQVYCSPECKRAAFSEGQKSLTKCERCNVPFIGTARFCGMRCAKRAEWEADLEIQAKMPKILEMYERQIGLKAISKELGVPRTTVRKWLDIAGKREVRNCSEARKASPVKRGDLLSGSKLALTAELRARKEKRKKLAGSCISAVLALDLFSFAKEKRKEMARARQKDRMAEKVSSLGFKSEFHMRYQTDPKFRARDIMKRRFSKIVKGRKISSRMLALLGCSSDGLRQWIESQWEHWMTWDNLGPQRPGHWQIDHIIPCSWFDQEKQEDLEICWHYMNLRPISALENNKRSNRPTNLIETIQGRPDHPMKERMLAWVKSRGL
jgi:hypothetical protein